MRTRSRRVLQDKTPGNTPQSQRSYVSATKENSSRKPLQALKVHVHPSPFPPPDENGTPIPMPPSPKPVHVRHIPQPESDSEVDYPPSPSPVKIRRPLGALRLLSDAASHAPDENRSPKVVPRSPHPKHVRTLTHPANTDEILASPTPVKSAGTASLPPLPAESTPLPFRRRKPRLPLHALPSRVREKAKDPRSAGSPTPLPREYSPLPPSSPPAYSVSSQQPNFRREPHEVVVEDGSEINEEGEDKENMASSRPLGAFYVRRDGLPEDDDPFGFLAAERKLKVMRGPSTVVSHKGKGKDPAVSRRPPLGTLSLTRRPSPSPAPSAAQLPTPGTDDEHNIDDLYLDSPRPHRLAGPSTEGTYGLTVDEEHNEYDADSDDLKENAPPPTAPLTIASVLQAVPRIPSSSPPRDPLRTPHKPRSARKRTPLPSPDFSGSSSDPVASSPITEVPRARSRSRSVGFGERSSPSPSRAASVRRASALANAAALRRDEADVSPVPMLRQKRKRTQREESDEDSMEAVRKLEERLPKRPVKRVARGVGASRGRGRGRGRGRPMVHIVEADSDSASESESESEGDEDARGKKNAGGAATRGRGVRGRGRGRGRARGKSTAVTTTTGATGSTANSGQDKGKKRAREETDPDEEEERLRARQARIEYFRKLDKEYSLEKEDVYVI